MFEIFNSTFWTSVRPSSVGGAGARKDPAAERGRGAGERFTSQSGRWMIN
jgi:hypothetical protein